MLRKREPPPPPPGFDELSVAMWQVLFRIRDGQPIGDGRSQCGAREQTVAALKRRGMLTKGGKLTRKARDVIEFDATGAYGP